MGPDLWLRFPSGNFESNSTTFSSSCLFDISEILSFKLGNELLHVHLSVLEQYVKLSNIVAWINLNHSVETIQFVLLTFAFLLFNLAIGRGVEAVFILGVIALLASVGSVVALGECRFLTGLGALSLVLGSILVSNALWLSMLPVALVL
jgi:hypothetical protein